jgi:acetyltransferase-like isoleucine patch superfamily enzyme
MNILRLLLWITSDIKDKIVRRYAIYKIQNKFYSVRFEEDVLIKNPGRLTVGKNVIVQKGTILHCGGMEWSRGKGYIKIGDDSVISPYCIFYGAGGIEIGNRFDCGPNVMIFSSYSDYNVRIIGEKNDAKCFGKVAIGNYVILFAGVIVSVGVTIGDGAVVAAGSVVLSDIPPMEVWGGVPAKLIRPIKE